MKKIKKILSVFTVFALALSMCIVVNAANVTVDSSFAGHTFEIRKILTGNQPEGDNTGLLTDIEWADATAGNALLNELKGDETLIVAAASGVEEKKVKDYFTNTTNPIDTAKEFAQVLSSNQGVADKLGTAVATKAQSISGFPVIKSDVTSTTGTVTLDPGYYLIVDKTATDTLTGNDVLNASLLQVTGKETINISKKTEAPTLVKKVQENYEYTVDKGFESADGKDGWNDAANYCIGDSVPFKVTATIEDLTAYSSYKAVITDTLDAGFTAPAQADVHVTVNGVDNTTGVVAVSGQKITVTFADIKPLANADGQAVIEVNYDAVLDADAVIGTAGNENKAYLTYTCNPNLGTDVKDTVVDEVVVYTMALGIKKVDEADPDGAELTGAKFKVQRTSDNKYAQIDADGKVTGWINETETVKGTEYEIKADHKDIIGLDEGTYKLYETVAPKGYNKPAADDPFEVVIDATVGFGDDYDGATSKFTDLSVTADTQPGTVELASGKATVKITNTKGSTLPETGGMGTTLFYILGGLLVVGAGVVLVSKKRLESK